MTRDEDSSLSMKYDEKFVYFLAYQKGFQEGQETLYIPIDTTQKTGSNYCENYKLKFEREADFLIVIDGKENSRVLVQERYDVLRAYVSEETGQRNPYINPPELKFCRMFNSINLILQMRNIIVPDGRCRLKHTKPDF